jgi:hypothetical protein
VPALSDPNGKLGNYVVTLQNGTLTITRSNISLALPSFNPPGGTYQMGQSVVISEATSGAAAIHYTTDGSTPTASSALYTGPVVLSTAATIQAMATQPEYLDSGVSSASYSVRIPVTANPTGLTAQTCQSANSTVTVPAVSGLSGSLALSVSGLPAGTTASFSPASIVNSGSSTLTVTPSSSTPTGNFTLTITVTGAAQSGSTTGQLKVKACK